MFTSKQFSVLIGSIFLISSQSSLSATQTQQILNASLNSPKAQLIQTQLIAQSDSIVFKDYVFNAAYYLSKYQDLREEFGRRNYEAARRHWQNGGIAEGRQGHPAFSAKYYLAKYPDLAANFGTVGSDAYVRGMRHWLMGGIAECRQGSPDFNPRFYLDNNPDVAQAVGKSNCKGAIDHWVKYGIKEGRRGAE